MEEGFFASQNSPRPDSGHDAEQPSELPAHDGSTGSKLIIKASSYQELACSGSKRKAGSTVPDTSAGSVAKEKRQNTGSKTQPAQDLKIIHHRFSNGMSGNGMSGNGRSDNGEVGINNGATTNDDSSQNNQPSLASPGHLMYQDTRSGTWRTTERLPRKKHITHGDSEPAKCRTRKPQTKKSNNHSVTLPSHQSGNRLTTFPFESTSDDDVSAPSQSQDSSACHQGGVIPHLCTGAACEFPGCYPISYELQALGAQFGGNSVNPQAFSPNNYTNNQGFGAFGGEVPFTHGYQPTFAPVSAPPSHISPVAHGLVWESRATRRARAQNNGH